jgi:anti-sigma B factor antagonist
MALKMTVREAPGGVVIVDLKGRLVLGAATSSLREMLAHRIEAGDNRLILNLRDLQAIDSSGAGELIAAHAAAVKAGGALKLLNLSYRTLDLLKITRLYLVFELYASEAAAVRSFQPAAPPSDLQIRWADFMDLVTRLGAGRKPRAHA